MIGYANTRHLVAAEEKGVLPLVDQRSDVPFSKAVIYRIVPVFSVQKNLISKIIEVINRLLQPVPHRLSGHTHSFLKQSESLPINESVEEESVEHEIGHQPRGQHAARNTLYDRDFLLILLGKVAT